MPRRNTAHQSPLPEKTLVVDNGAYTIKAGFAFSSPTVEHCHIIPNCLARERNRKVWVGPEIDGCRDFGEMAFRRPVEKGYLVNWEAEKAIWDSTFFDPKSKLNCVPHDTNLVLTEAPNTPVALQTNCDQVVFEEYGFATYSRHIGCQSPSWSPHRQLIIKSAPSLNAYNDIQNLFGAPARGMDISADPAECLLVIDSAFSHSTVTPLYKGRPIQQAIRRLDIGGRILTNYLKEILSIRHYNLMNEEHLVNEAKEKICFVSNQFRNDLEQTSQGVVLAQDGRENKSDEREVVVDYVLPDYNTGSEGYVRPHDPSPAARMKKMGAVANPGAVVEDFMTLGNERFAVPELLFNPMDVGMKEAGLPETVVQSMSGLPPGLWPAMLANIVVVGGNCLMDGFMERL
ncbi:MAG: hypothetical protein Q9216_002054 [Gyalolechia sp. 2 TL-2023]